MDFTKECGKLEPIGTARDHPFDNIGTKPFIAKFLCRMSSPDVLRAEPHFVTNIVLWGFTSVSIIRSGHVVGCLD